MANYKVRLLSEKHSLDVTIECPDDKFILEAAEDNNIELPYSCRAGSCSTCLGKVTEGNAVMVKNSILTDQEVNEGFILTCQAHPTTPKISIDYDDV